jgi:hypothetical protein
LACIPSPNSVHYAIRHKIFTAPSGQTEIPSQRRLGPRPRPVLCSAHNH